MKGWLLACKSVTIAGHSHYCHVNITHTVCHASHDHAFLHTPPPTQGMLNLSSVQHSQSIFSLLSCDLSTHTVMYVHAAGWQHSEKSVTSPKLTGKPKEVVTILHRVHFTSALKRMATLVRVRPAAPCLEIGITLCNGQPCKPLQALETCLDVFLFLVHGDTYYM